MFIAKPATIHVILHSQLDFCVCCAAAQVAHKALQRGAQPTAAQQQAAEAALQDLRGALPADLQQQPRVTCQYLTTFLTRPFMSPLLAHVEGAGVRLGLGVVHLVCLMLKLLLQQQLALRQTRNTGTTAAPQQQQQQQAADLSSISSSLLDDLVAGAAYQLPKDALRWLAGKGPASQGITWFVSNHLQQVPVPAEQPGTQAPSAATSSGAPPEPVAAGGVCRLLRLLGAATGGGGGARCPTASVDGLVWLLEQLVVVKGDQVVAACCGPEGGSLWQLWARPLVITRVECDDPQLAAALQAGVGQNGVPGAASAVLPGGNSPGQRAATKATLHWSDGTEQVVLAGSSPKPRPGCAKLLERLLQRCSPQQLAALMDLLQQQLQAQYSAGSAVATTSQQHTVKAFVGLVGVTAGLRPSAAASSGRSSSEAASDVPAAALALLRLVPLVSPDWADSVGVSLHQHLVCELARLLVVESDMPAAVVGQLHTTISSSGWPLQQEQLRGSWLLGQHQQVAGGRDAALAQALISLGDPQLAAVVELMVGWLQGWPADARALPRELLLQALLARCWEEGVQGQVDAGSVSAGVGPRAAAAACRPERVTAGVVAQVVWLLDGGDSSMFGLLLQEAVASDRGATQEASVQVLLRCLASAPAAKAVAAALQNLAEVGHDGVGAATAADTLLQAGWELGDAGVVVSVLEVVGQVFTAAAPRSLLQALAHAGGGRFVRRLVSVWHAGDVLLSHAASAGAATAQLLARLVPHMDREVAVPLLELLVAAPASPGRVALGDPSGDTGDGVVPLWECNLEAHELLQVFVALLQAGQQEEDSAGGAGAQPALLEWYWAGLLTALVSGQGSQEPARGAGPHPPLHQLQVVAAVLRQVGDSSNSLAAAVKGLCRQQQHLEQLYQLLASPCQALQMAALGCLQAVLPSGVTEEVTAAQAAQQAAQAAAGAPYAVEPQWSTSNTTDMEIDDGQQQQQKAGVKFFQLKVAQGSRKRPLAAGDVQEVIKRLVAHRQRLQAASSTRRGKAGVGRHTPRLPQLVKACSTLEAADSGSHSDNTADASLRPASNEVSSSSGGGSPTSSTSLVLTPTTQENLERILDVVDNPQPLLLEGPTGVGKSAIIAEAARQRGARLVRFNMSSRLTIDDLLGRVLLKGGVSPGGSPGAGAAVPRLELQLQPFSEAFVGGHWLLLDELNLAPDDVLQCIEQAIDTGVSRKGQEGGACGQGQLQATEVD
jgi:hypothetical protein